MERIEFKEYEPATGARFSIVIPTWNNLPYVQLCVDSIRKNSRYPHQIILHVNEGSDGTRAWADEQKLAHSHSAKNVGVCYAVNAAATLVKTDYMVYMNDDMYVCPDWDHYLWQEIEALGHSQFFISSTIIEPKDTGNPCVIVSDAFGDSIENFREDDLKNRFIDFTKEDWQGGTWPPNIIPKKLWDLVGGYSVEFSPGMYSDPDFSRKLWEAGVRLFKGCGKSRVFHFMCKSTGRVVKNDGRRQFREKWGIPSSKFTKYYLHIGSSFDGPLTEPEETLALKWARLRARLPF
ncbi:MAG: glycosyltransferase [Nitrospinota bacterium]|nr:glycosyltransferase [Nitrospinota bacterium]